MRKWPDCMSFKLQLQIAPKVASMSSCCLIPRRVVKSGPPNAPAFPLHPSSFCSLEGARCGAWLAIM